MRFTDWKGGMPGERRLGVCLLDRWGQVTYKDAAHMRGKLAALSSSLQLRRCDGNQAARLCNELLQ